MNNFDNFDRNFKIMWRCAIAIIVVVFIVQAALWSVGITAAIKAVNSCDGNLAKCAGKLAKDFKDGMDGK